MAIFNLGLFCFFFALSINSLSILSFINCSCLESGKLPNSLFNVVSHEPIILSSVVGVKI